MALYFRTTLKADQFHLPDDIHPFECLGLLIHLNTGSDFLLLAIYLGHEADAFPAATFIRLLSLHPRTVIIGDFNARHTAWGCVSRNTRGSQLYNLLQARDELYLIAANEPTHIPHRGQPTNIDIVLTNWDAINELECLHIFSSDHLPIGFTIPGHSPLRPSPKRLDVRKANWDEFRKLLPKSAYHLN